MPLLINFLLYDLDEINEYFEILKTNRQAQKFMRYIFTWFKNGNPIWNTKKIPKIVQRSPISDVPGPQISFRNLWAE